ncbi:hypothetical protein [Cupriavidus basilensis]|uniref:hypothetical protein n=1 Tax=Cupriavidus basilensis TaxID=68895 RepID=UPI0020A663E5|nr:hypothetical protein [Cupriavidus basilensis]MCP3017997.1 hypothetical protein [Cupriavidus basilensis]
MKKIIAVTSALFFAHQAAIAAVTAEKIILENAAKVSQLCSESLPIDGIACITVDDESAKQISDNTYDSGKIWEKVLAGTRQPMPMYRADTGTVDGLVGRSYRSALILVERKTSEEQSYLTAFTVVFSTTAFTPGASRVDDGEVPDFVRRQLDGAVKTASPGSAAAQEFFRKIDAPIILRRAEQQKNEKRAAEEANKQTPRYKADTAANSMRSCANNIVYARKGIEREQQIGRISGIVNKVSLYNYGSMIASCEAAMPRFWKEYKANGGEARSMADVFEQK